MTCWFLNQMLHRKSIIVLVDMLIVTTIITLILLMLILTLTPLRGILSMVYLMDLLAVIILFVMKQLLRQVLHCLLSHLLVCGWLRRTNSSAGLCLRWIRMGHESGCTNHMTGDKELFTEDKLTKSSQKY